MTAFSGNLYMRKLPLSGGTANGRRIKVAATATPGTLIHTGPSDTSLLDEVWIDAVNTSTAPVNVTIEYGGTTAPDDTMTITVQPKASAALVVPGNVLAGAATPLIIRAYADTANVITLGGYAHRLQ